MNSYEHFYISSTFVPKEIRVISCVGLSLRLGFRNTVLLKLVDDVNYAAINYDDKTANYPNKKISDIHFYNSMCIIRKSNVEQSVFKQIKG